MQDRDIYASTKGVGNASYTDFKVIFDKIFQAQRPGNVAVLVTDLIYSPKNTSGVSVEKILNEENTAVKRPGGGISPMLWDSVIGTPAIRDFIYDELIEI